MHPLQSNFFIPYSDSYRLSPISNTVRKQCKVILLFDFFEIRIADPVLTTLK